VTFGTFRGMDYLVPPYDKVDSILLLEHRSCRGA